MTENKKVLFHTLGCKLNYSETSSLAREFQDGGFVRVKNIAQGVDIHVINSCSVTDTADKKCRYLIRKIHRQTPSAIIAVTGCYAQLKPNEVAEIEGVDLVVGNNSKADILNLVSQIARKGGKSVLSCDSSEITSFFSSFSSGDRTRAFLKVQDVCSYKCSYCTIPFARGESRSISISEVIKQAEEIAQKGIKEIVITGVNTGDFGRNSNESFIDLIKELDRVEGIERYRISSIEPNLLTEQLAQFTTQSAKFQPHYHIPLQSGTDHILQLMRRRYDTALFSSRIDMLKSLDSDTFLGIDVIVGFPGESDDLFEQTYQYLENLQPAYLHIFPYSERQGTDAVAFEGSVPMEVRHKRVERLTKLSDELHYNFVSRYLNKRLKVLVEGFRKGGVMYGYSSNYIKVEMPYRKELINQIVEVEIQSVMPGAVADGIIIE